MRVRAVRRTGLSARATRSRDASPAGEGRGLPIYRASRGVELLFQVFVFPPQALPLGFRPPQIFFELRDPARLIVNDVLWVTRRRRIVALRHAPVMPDSCAQYKRNPLRLCVSAARDPCEVRVSAVLTR